MSVNVCLDDIFWATEHFGTKCGMVMQHHESVSCGKNFCLLPSRSRSQRGLIWSEYGSFFWTADSMATRVGLMIHYHKPECLVEKLDYCIQGQSHSEGSKCQCLSTWYFLKCQIFVAKLGIVMHHHELECCPEWLVCCFQGQHHSKGYMIKYDSFNYSFWTADPFATKLSLIEHYHEPECLIKKLDYCVQGQGHNKISKCQWMFFWIA